MLALRNAMKRVTDLHTLSLSGYGSVYMSTQMLCSALQNVSPLKELLVRVAIGNQGVHRLAPSIKGNQTVVRLNLSGTAIGDIGAVQLAACLEDNLTLEDLDMSHVRFLAMYRECVRHDKHAPMSWLRYITYHDYCAELHGH